MTLAPWKYLAVAVLFLAACENDPTGTRRSREIEISSPGPFIDVGQTLQLSATAKDAAGVALDKARVVWTSDNPSVVTVEDGRVTGRSVGTAYIKASAGPAVDSVQLTVEAPVAELVVWPADTLRIISGRKATLVVEMRDDAGRPVPHSLEITSSEPSRVSVRGRELDAVALGSATVKVRAGARSVQVAVEVVTGARDIEKWLGGFGASDINNLGWIVGNKDGRPVLTELPVVGNHEVNRASLVNDSGTVVGVSGPPYSLPGKVLWTWRDGVVRQHPIPVRLDRLEWISPEGINDRGEIVGWIRVNEDRPGGRFLQVDYAFHFDGTEVRLIEPGRVRRAHAINNQGVILVDGFLYQNGALQEIPKPSPDASLWLGRDLNDKGQYVGIYSVHGTRPFYWGGSSFVDLGPKWSSSAAFHINEYGDALGEYVGASSSGVGGAVLFRNGVSSFIATGGANRGLAINDLGQLLIQPKHAGPNGPGTYLLSPGS